MSKQLIVRLDEGELKVYTPEAGKEWSSIKRSEVLELIKEEIESLGVNTETGGGESSIKQSEVERIVDEKIGLSGVSEDIRERIARLEKARAPSEEIDDGGKGIDALKEEVELLKKKVIREEEGGKLKIYTPEAGKDWTSIKWSEIEQMVDEKIGLLGPNTKTGDAGPVVPKQTSPDDIGPILNEGAVLEDLGGRRIEEDIV